MRNGKVRCRNKSTCNLNTCPAKNNLQQAKELQDQLIQRAAAIYHQRHEATPAAWADIEYKIELLMKWSLCKKHVAQCDAAARMTLAFFKQECGIFVKDESNKASVETPTNKHASQSTEGTQSTFPPPPVETPDTPTSPTVPGPSKSHKSVRFENDTPSGETTQGDQSPSASTRPQSHPAQQPSPSRSTHETTKKESTSNPEPTSLPQVPHGFQVRAAVVEEYAPGSHPSRSKISKSKLSPPTTPYPEASAVHHTDDQPKPDAQDTTQPKVTPTGSHVREPTQQAPAFTSQHKYTEAHQKTKSPTADEHQPSSAAYETTDTSAEDPDHQALPLPIDEMIDNYEALSFSVLELENENEGLRDDLEAAEETIEDLRGELQDAERMIRALRKEVRDAKREARR